MPPIDSRFRNAAGDIRQDRINWNDWSDDWIFTDPRFNLLHGPDDAFLKFLCEIVHPVVRPDTDEALSLVDEFNQDLMIDGWRIVEVERISGKPVFGFQQGEARAAVSNEPTGWLKVDRQLQEVRLRLDSAQTEEQFQAVGTRVLSY